jgi:hypothetical protein
VKSSLRCMRAMRILKHHRRAIRAMSAKKNATERRDKMPRRCPSFFETMGERSCFTEARSAPSCWQQRC